MKKLLTIAVCASAVAAFADATEITVGRVGVTKITSSLKNTVVATSYDDLAGGSIAISNIVKTANLTTGDKLYVFTGRNAYDGYTLKESGGVKYWDKNLNITIAADGTESSTESASPNLATLAVGEGFWLVRASTPAVAFDFYIYGKPASASATSLTANSIALIGNPTQTDKAPTISNPTNGDRIMVPSAASTGLTIYTYNETNAQWWYRAPGSNTRVLLDNPPAIPAGTGFWYDPKGATQVSW